MGLSAQEQTTNPNIEENVEKEVAEQKEKLSKEQAEGIVVAEQTILVYSGLSGRQGLDQIRKTTVEIGKVTLTNPDGSTRDAEYERRIKRGEDLNKEKIRVEQKFPDAQFSLIYTGDKIFGIFNKAVFTPRVEASSALEDQIWHGIEALLRYKENGSKVELVGTEKIMGVDLHILNVMDKEGRETKFYISKKTLRVMMLEYEKNGVKYKRKFYDHNYAQRTLVPYKTVLWADDKKVEETTISTITFGQTVEDDLFESS